MSEVGTRITSKDQVLFYLKQSMYLTKIIEKLSPSFEPDVEDYRKQLQNLENIVKRQVAVNREPLQNKNLAPPETPVRNSAHFDFSIANQKKSALKREKSKDNARPITIVHKTTSMKNLTGAKGQTFRKSISFIEPEK